jgi:hypothetical protein
VDECVVTTDEEKTNFNREKAKKAARQLIK